jgi:hypothetical protein
MRVRSCRGGANPKRFAPNRFEKRQGGGGRISHIHALGTRLRRHRDRWLVRYQPCSDQTPEVRDARSLASAQSAPDPGDLAQRLQDIVGADGDIHPFAPPDWHARSVR